MSEWICVYDALPPAYTPVFVWWRDREILFGCYLIEKDERSSKDDPAEYWYSYEDEKTKWAYLWKSASGLGNLEWPCNPIQEQIDLALYKKKQWKEKHE